MIMCISSDKRKTVENRYNERGFRNVPFDPYNRQLGLSLLSVQIIHNSLVCSFKRRNYNEHPKLTNLKDPSRKLYLIAAYGSVDYDGSMI